MKNTVDYNPFRGPAIQRVIPMIQAQAEIWIACKLGGDDANRAYNESVSLLIEGSLDINALHQAIEKMTERHEALRATFNPRRSFYDRFRID
ncbi:condensation domain-containing protein [Maribacter litopenaei]|uniref:Condensation domain-containing protein n=1 Tax=Maribacter litopenaei TaxID=2976127 RepID=A0ABY5YAL5_9FLAO|nr:condensation domain-containing protein [Maribacter litopenaei]UWX56081.1 condensation domain-containing protein [Maribacter litopenaei]